MVGESAVKELAKWLWLEGKREVTKQEIFQWAVKKGYSYSTVAQALRTLEYAGLIKRIGHRGRAYMVMLGAIEVMFEKEGEEA